MARSNQQERRGKGHPRWSNPSLGIDRTELKTRWLNCTDPIKGRNRRQKQESSNWQISNISVAFILWNYIYSLESLMWCIYIYFAELFLLCLVLLDWYNRTSYTNWGCSFQHSFCAAHWGRLEFQYYGEHDTASFELMWIFAIIVKTRIQFLSQGIVKD